MDDTEESETIESDLPINVSVDAPSCSCPLLTENPLLFLKSLVLRWIASQVEASVKNSPVDLIVGSFEVPVEHHMGGDVPVSESIASWKQLSALTEVHTEVREWLISSPAVHNLSSNEVLWPSRADGRAECLHLTDSVRVLIKPPLAEGTKVEQSTLLIEMRLEDEFVRPVVKVLGLHLCVLKLLGMWFHWWDRAERRFLANSAEASRGSRTHSLRAEVLLSVGHLLNLLIEIRATSSLIEAWLSLIRFWWFSLHVKHLLELIVKTCLFDGSRISSLDLSNTLYESANCSTDLVLLLVCLVLLFLEMSPHLDVDFMILLFGILMLVQFD